MADVLAGSTVYPPAVTYPSIEDLLGNNLEAGERRLSFAAVRQRTGEGSEPEEGAVVLTDRRLLLVSVAWPTDYELKTSLPRSSCAILRHHDDPEGSSRLALGTPDGELDLEFPSQWRREAYAIREALTDHERQAPEPMLGADSDGSLRHALGDVWREQLIASPSASVEAGRARILYEAVLGPADGFDQAFGDDVFAELRGLSATEDPED